MAQTVSGGNLDAEAQVWF